jgi:hypothetical protein
VRLGRCRESVGAGFEFGIHCVGSSIGLMVMLLALGARNVDRRDRRQDLLSEHEDCDDRDCRLRNRHRRVTERRYRNDEPQNWNA